MVGFPVACALAKAGRKVIGLDPAPPPFECDGVETIERGVGGLDDMRDLIARYSVEKIIHAGAISGPMLSRDDPYLICQTNMIATAGLVEAARRTGVTRLVYCSSASAFGNTPPAPVPDDAPMRPTTLYGATKAACDHIIAAYRAQYGLDAIGLRLSTVYGPGRRTACAIRTMIADALTGAKSRFEYRGDTCRHYLFVDDAVQAVVKALDADPAPQYAHNIAGPDYVPMSRIAEIIGENASGADITFGDDEDDALDRRERLDISAAERNFGFAREFGIERGIVAYLKWWRESGVLPNS